MTTRRLPRASFAGLAASLLVLAPCYWQLRLQVAAGIPFQFCIISAAAVFLLPGTVLIPGFYHALSGKFVVRSLEAGALCGNTRWKTLPDLLPIS